MFQHVWPYATNEYQVCFSNIGCEKSPGLLFVVGMGYWSSSRIGAQRFIWLYRRQLWSMSPDCCLGRHGVRDGRRRLMQVSLSVGLCRPDHNRVSVCCRGTWTDALHWASHHVIEKAGNVEDEKWSTSVFFVLTIKTSSVMWQQAGQVCVGTRQQCG